MKFFPIGFGTNMMNFCTDLVVSKTDEREELRMFKKGDRVVFNISSDKTVYILKTDEYSLHGRIVVDLQNYEGEVAVEYLYKCEYVSESDLN